METYQGICRYCGDIQPILADNQSEWVERTSRICSCGGMKEEKKRIKLMERIDYIAKGEYNAIFQSLQEPVVMMLKQAGMDVLAEKCSAVDFVILDSRIKIWADGEKVKVSRTGTRKEVTEA